jgi:hypothetical protein
MTIGADTIVCLIKRGAPRVTPDATLRVWASMTGPGKRGSSISARSWSIWSGAASSMSSPCAPPMRRDTGQDGA